MFSVITNIYNKKTKGPTLMELFTATGKLNFFWQLEMFDGCPTGGTAHIDAIFKFLPHAGQYGCIHILRCCIDPCLFQFSCVLRANTTAVYMAAPVRNILDTTSYNRTGWLPASQPTGSIWHRMTHVPHPSRIPKMSGSFHKSKAVWILTSSPPYAFMQ
jgi:hypothetical protein